MKVEFSKISDDTLMNFALAKKGDYRNYARIFIDSLQQNPTFIEYLNMSDDIEKDSFIDSMCRKAEIHKLPHQARVILRISLKERLFCQVKGATIKNDFSDNIEYTFGILFDINRIILSRPNLLNQIERITWLAVLSGLCFEEALDSFISSITKKEEFCQNHQGYLAFPVKYNKKSHRPNCIENGQYYTVRNFYPSKKCLMAIRDYYRSSESTQMQPIKSRKILDNIFKKTLHGCHLNSTSNTALFSGLGLLFLRQPDLSIPAFIYAYATGMSDSSSSSIEILLTDKIKSKYTSPNGGKVHAQTAQKQNVPVVDDEHEAQCRAYIATLRNYCKPREEDGTKRRVDSALKQLKSGDQPETFGQEITRDFIIDKFIHKDWTATSTALRFISAIGRKFIIAMEQLRSSDCSCEVISDLYETLHSERALKDPVSVAQLNTLLQFASERYSIPLPEHLMNAPKNQSLAKTAVVNEFLFNKLLESIPDLFPDEAPSIHEQICVSLIFMRRLGLRPSEAFRIHIRDIDPTGNGCVRVRSNEHGKNKTHSADRILPIFALLTEGEHKVVERFLNRRFHEEKSNRRLLFTSESNYQYPLQTQNISPPVSEFLSQATGQSCALYQLRHTCISYMSLVLFGSEKLVTTVTPYSAAQMMKIRKLILTGHKSDHFYQLSAFAGHLSPETTIATYSHLLDLLTKDFIEMELGTLSQRGSLTQTASRTSEDHL